VGDALELWIVRSTFYRFSDPRGARVVTNRQLYNGEVNVAWYQRTATKFCNSSPVRDSSTDQEVQHGF